MSMKSLPKFTSNISWAVCLMLSMITLTGYGQQQAVTGKITSTEDGRSEERRVGKECV